MKKAITVLTALVFVLTLSATGFAADPSITGVWSMPVIKGKDKGKERLQIEIFEKDGVYYGKIVKFAPAVFPNGLCRDCKSDRKDKPLTGMLTLWDLKKEAGRYAGGTVYDVEQGKEYKCSMVLVSPDKLKVTATLLFLSESHYWTRVK